MAANPLFIWFYRARTTFQGNENKFDTGNMRLLAVDNLWTRSGEVDMALWKNKLSAGTSDTAWIVALLLALLCVVLLAALV